MRFSLQKMIKMIEITKENDLKSKIFSFPNFFRFIQNFYIKIFIKSAFLFVSITHSEFTDDFFFFFFFHCFRVAHGH